MAEWRWAAASRCGTSHIAAGTRRQDAYRIAAPSDHGFLAVAACDGAGSAERGGEGASITAWMLAASARSWLNAERRLPDPARARMWATLARLRIANAACERWLDPRDFATTAILAMSDGNATMTISVGDGAAVARDAASGEWLTLSWPEQGEFASTTYFITDEELRLRIGMHLTPVDRLVVMTDGLERIALDFAMRAPHARFLDAMVAPLQACPPGGRNWAVSREISDFLDSERVNERTDDDKTLIVAALV